MTELDQDLPDEILEEHASADEARLEKIAALSMIVSRRRDEAVSGRANSGIEEEWSEDNDAYEGIDDANRSDQKVIKPSTSAGGITRRTAQSATRSTVYLNITRPYTDSAAARIGDMLMPTDDRSWQLKVEPVAEPTMMAQPAQPASMAPIPQPAPQGAAPVMQGQQPPSAMTPVADAIAQQNEQAAQPVERAQRRIDDWLVESQWHGECRKVIDDCCRIGVGILKGPFPTKKKAKKVQQSEQGLALEIMLKVKPSSKRIDPWNFYPDPACGENIHNGNYVIEHDSLTEKQLRDLKGLEGYIAEQITECIKEGPQKKYADSKSPTDKNRSEKDLYDVWYYYGAISADDLIAAGVKEVKEGEDSRYAIITIVNDRAIKAALNPLDSGEFPYDVVPYQRRSGTWTGIGVARQVRVPQGMINAGTRNMMDNAALSGGPLYAIDRQMLEPIDQSWTLTPRKGFYTTASAEGKSIKDAIAFFNVPSMQAELMNIIQFALKMAEDVTGLPMLLQGQSGAAPDTLGGQLIVNNNAAAVLRRFARMWDDCITEPHIGRYYEYLLMYGEDDSEKGVFTVDARGSSALVERDIQNHAAIQMMQASLNPAFGLSPKKAAEEALKAQKLDVKRFQMSPDEQAAAAQQQAPEAPAVQAAKIRVQGDLQKTQMVLGQKAQEAQQDADLERELAQIDANLQAHKVSVDTDRDTVYVQAQTQRDQTSAMLKQRELEIKRELALLDYANKREISLEQVKAELAKTSMAESTKRELAQAQIALNQAESHQDRMVDLHKHHTTLANAPKPPEPIEPAGRAPNGQSFAK